MRKVGDGYIGHWSNRRVGSFEITTVENRRAEMRIVYDAPHGTNMCSSCLWIVPGTRTEPRAELLQGVPYEPRSEQ